MVNVYPMDYAYIGRWQSDLVYTKESVLPDCNKPYHTNNQSKCGRRLMVCGSMPCNVELKKRGPTTYLSHTMLNPKL